jgi:hypothetical protein
MKGVLMKKKGLVLTILACAGVVSTTVLAVKATPKVVKIMEKHKSEELTAMQKVALAAPAYIPAIASGAATMVCIVGIGVLGRRHQAALASAYALVSNNYKRYQNKVKELYGEEVHNNVVDALVKEDCKDVDVYSVGLCGRSSLESFEEEDHLFYDEYSGRYFETKMSKVLQAEYHLNRNYCLGGGVPVNMFYEFLGLPPIDCGDDIGWTFSDYEIYWIDFNHKIVELDDGLECCVICMEFTPMNMEESYEV